jgi:hypothetical protein
MIGVAVRAVADTARRIFRPEPAQIFHNELAWWDLLGFFMASTCIACDE